MHKLGLNCPWCAPQLMLSHLSRRFLFSGFMTSMILVVPDSRHVKSWCWSFVDGRRRTVRSIERWKKASRCFKCLSAEIISRNLSAIKITHDCCHVHFQCDGKVLTSRTAQLECDCLNRGLLPDGDFTRRRTCHAKVRCAPAGGIIGRYSGFSWEVIEISAGGRPVGRTNYVSSCWELVLIIYSVIPSRKRLSEPVSSSAFTIIFRSGASREQS